MVDHLFTKVQILEVQTYSDQCLWYIIEPTASMYKMYNNFGCWHFQRNSDGNKKFPLSNKQLTKNVEQTDPLKTYQLGTDFFSTKDLL